MVTRRRLRLTLLCLLDLLAIYWAIQTHWAAPTAPAPTHVIEPERARRIG